MLLFLAGNAIQLHLQLLLLLQNDNERSSIAILADVMVASIKRSNWLHCAQDYRSGEGFRDYSYCSAPKNSIPFFCPLWLLLVCIWIVVTKPGSIADNA